MMGLKGMAFEAIAKVLLFLLFVGFCAGWRGVLAGWYYKMTFTMLKKIQI